MALCRPDEEGLLDEVARVRSVARQAQGKAVERRVVRVHQLRESLVVHRSSVSWSVFPSVLFQFRAKMERIPGCPPCPLSACTSRRTSPPPARGMPSRSGSSWMPGRRNPESSPRWRSSRAGAARKGRRRSSSSPAGSCGTSPRPRMQCPLSSRMADLCNGLMTISLWSRRSRLRARLTPRPQNPRKRSTLSRWWSTDPSTTSRSPSRRGRTGVMRECSSSSSPPALSWSPRTGSGGCATDTRLSHSWPPTASACGRSLGRNSPRTSPNGPGTSPPRRSPARPLRPAGDGRWSSAFAPVRRANRRSAQPLTRAEAMSRRRVGSFSSIPRASKGWRRRRGRSPTAAASPRRPAAGT